MTASETDADLEFVRQLHLELNGSGRRTRGAPPPQAKRFKGENSKQRSEGPRDTPSISRSGSGSGSGSAKLIRREGTILKRLIKKQPETDSSHHTGMDEEAGMAELAATGNQPSLEPQASTRDGAKGNEPQLRGTDIRSRQIEEYIDEGYLTVAPMVAEDAVKLARAAAARDANASVSPRIKCFYQGCSYGLSFAPTVLATRDSLAEALKAALAAESFPVCSAHQLEITALDSEGKKRQCAPEDTESCWQSVMTTAKRIYVTSSTLPD